MVEKENFDEKFKDILGSESSYEFFLKIQFLIPKYSKKPDTEYFPFIKFALNHLISLKENESVSSLLDLSIKNYKKSHKTKNITDPNFFLKFFHDIFNSLPVEIDKSYFKYTFLELCEANNITEDVLLNQNIYYDFAIDSIKNNFLAEGYRFSMKALKLDVINSVVNKILADEKIKMDCKEQNVFIARTCLEILVNKNVEIALEFISSFISAKNEFEDNKPLLNMCYLMCNLLKDNNCSFEKFNELALIYKSCIENSEKNLKKYINKISNDRFNKIVFLDANNPLGGFNFLNMMKLVTNIANQFGGD